MKQTRRETLTMIGAAAVAPALAQLLVAAEVTEHSDTLIATNTYPWLTFARRAKQPFHLHSEELLARIAATGIRGYEPIIEDPTEFEGLGDRLQMHGLEMRSIYVNSVLHDPNKVEQSIEQVLQIADDARKLGVKIIVTNPSPIRWGGPENKNDGQLRLQADSLDRLGGQLRERGLTLAYHNHDAELREGAREFHHMLTATDPTNVKFCLDAHWVFRGCGNSEVAVFDALEHYHSRVIELHLRQSTSGVWNESFTMEGDINYQQLFNLLTDSGNDPHLVLEQAVEDASPNELSAQGAHRLSFSNLKKALS